jgi:hypothetical protein
MYAAPGTIAQTVAPYAWERLMREYSAILRRNIS